MWSNQTPTHGVPVTEETEVEVSDDSGSGGEVPLYQKFIMHHAGGAEGGGGTYRVNLWFDAEPTEPLMSHLSRLVDALGIEGILNVVRAEPGQHFKVQLIISIEVDVSNAAALWIGRFNSHIAKQPGQVLDYLGDADSVKYMMATPSVVGSFGDSSA
jgi:hypothetical protein